MRVKLVSVACLMSAAIPEAHGDEAAWDLESKASAWLCKSPLARGAREERTFIAGEPIGISVVLEKPRVVRGRERAVPACRCPQADVAFSAEVVPAKGGPSFKPELFFAKGTVGIALPSADGWWSGKWFFLDDRISPGRYVLKLKPGVRLLKITRFSPDEIEFEVRRPEDDSERFNVRIARAAFFFDTGRQEIAERILLRLDAEMPGYRETVETLGMLYSTFCPRRSVEYFKELVRRFAAGRPNNPTTAKWRKGVDTKDGLPRHVPRVFAGVAVRAGLVTNEEQGLEMFDRIVADAEAGKDLGQLDARFRRPLLGQ